MVLEVSTTSVATDPDDCKETDRHDLDGAPQHTQLQRKPTTQSFNDREKRYPQPRHLPQPQLTCTQGCSTPAAPDPQPAERRSMRHAYESPSAAPWQISPLGAVCSACEPQLAGTRRRGTAALHARQRGRGVGALGLEALGAPDVAAVACAAEAKKRAALNGAAELARARAPVPAGVAAIRAGRGRRNGPTSPLMHHAAADERHTAGPQQTRQRGRSGDRPHRCCLLASSMHVVRCSAAVLYPFMDRGVLVCSNTSCIMITYMMHGSRLHLLWHRQPLHVSNAVHAYACIRTRPGIRTGNISSAACGPAPGRRPGGPPGSPPPPKSPPPAAHQRSRRRGRRHLGPAPVWPWTRARCCLHCPAGP